MNARIKAVIAKLAKMPLKKTEKSIVAKIVRMKKAAGITDVVVDI